MTIGQRGFGSKSVRDIFVDLYERYGTVTPDDIKNLTLNLYKEWNPSTPIESFLLNIETQQVFATKASRPFHPYLLIEAALSVIKQTRQFKDELKEYAKEHPNSTLTQWHQFKRFWIEKYEEYERDRTTMAESGYHGASNAAETDDSSLASLTEAFTSLQSERSAQNLAMQAMLQKIETLSQIVTANQASNIQHPPQIPANIQFPPAQPAYNPYQYAPMPPPPPPAAYPAYPAPPPMINQAAGAPPPPPPPPPPAQYQQYAAPPQQNTQYNQSYGGGSNRGRNNRSKGGRGAANAQRSNPPHPVKRYNNWWYCYSCGFDTPHEGNACTRQATGHNSHLTREMKVADMHRPADQQQYRQASHSGHHKRFLPSQAAANGYPQYQRDS